MSMQEIKTLVNEPYSPGRRKDYRIAYKIVFNKTASNCGCNCNKIYNKIKQAL